MTRAAALCYIRYAVHMQATATMFAVMNGFIIATILSSASSRHRYKERMDMVVVRPPALSPCPACYPLLP